MAEQDRKRTIALGQPDHSRLPEFGRRDKSRLPEFGVQVAGDMVVIPAGEFLMGTTDQQADWVVRTDSQVSRSWMSDEQPQHAVYLDAFALDVHPVTVAQYRAFCEATGRQEPPPPGWGWLDDHPVVNVTWHDAAAYCSWANKRLPTEAEWEKAARGEEGRLFPWGNDWNPRAAHCAYQHQCEWSGKTAPVGSHPDGISPSGCHDMIGNVWEWCADWYDGSSYRNSLRQNPKGPDSGGARVLRGGAWPDGDLGRLRCATRYDDIPAIWSADGGFRCAQDL
jgi:formylglycine-generating enzyme required for sulfatase activity